jgi:hypothetical protein
LVEIDDLLGPDILLDIVVNVSEVSDICEFLLFSPLFVDGLSEFLKSPLKPFEMLIVVGKHVAEIPLALAVLVKIVAIHVIGTSLGWGLG